MNKPGSMKLTFSKIAVKKPLATQTQPPSQLSIQTDSDSDSESDSNSDVLKQPRDHKNTLSEPTIDVNALFGVTTTATTTTSAKIAPTGRDGVVDEMNRKMTSYHNAMVQARSKNSKYDDSIFAYDEMYDDIVSKRQKTQLSMEQDDRDRKKDSSIMENLLERAELRKKEREMMKERVLLRQQLREEQEIGPVERFVTSAYKKKLAENKAWEEKLRKQDEEDEKTAKANLARKSTEFYQSLRTDIGIEDSKIPQKSADSEKDSKFQQNRSSMYSISGITPTVSPGVSQSLKTRTYMKNAEEEEYLKQWSSGATETSMSMSATSKTNPQTSASELDLLFETGAASFDAPIGSEDADLKAQRLAMMRERALARQKSNK